VKEEEGIAWREKGEKRGTIKLYNGEGRGGKQ